GMEGVEHGTGEPGKKRVTRWGFVLGILQNRRQKGWTPPEAKSASPPPAVTLPKAPQPAASPPKLLPAELAELVAACSRPGPLGRLAAAQIRCALREGRIPAELVASIPAAILVGSEVPAPGSSS